MEGGATNRVLIVGAHGALGTLAVQAFRDAGWAVRSAARRPGRGEIGIDLDQPESIEAAVREDELVVNTVPHPDLHAERHVLEQGGALINVSALPAAAGRSLRAVAGGARGIVAMNAGLAPGVTTIVAADLLRLHPDATELEIVYTLSLATRRGPASVDFIHRGLRTIPRHRVAVVPLPRPFGQRVCVGFGEGDAGWLGGVAEGRIVRQYTCIAEPLVHERLLELNSAGRMNELQRSLIASRASPAHSAACGEPVAHWIAAVREGRRLSARTIECHGELTCAAQTAVVLADVLLSRPRPAGCFDPEELWTVGDVEAKLQVAGITVTSRVAPDAIVEWPGPYR